MIDVKKIGLRVRELRLQAGITQARLGELAGAHANTITQLEVGGLENISLAKLDDIATILGERVDVLIRRAKAVG